jgi:hypothetical protein
MSVTAKLYGSVTAKMANKEIDFDSDSIKVALCTSAYTPNQDTDDYFNDITNEVTGTGYTAGGQALSNKSVAYTSGTNTQAFKADPTVWTTSTITARYAVIYDATPGTAATNPLIGYVDFGADVTSTAGSFTITWDATNGVFSAAVA